jgi:hypothetical protein
MKLQSWVELTHVLWDAQPIIVWEKNHIMLYCMLKNPKSFVLGHS